MKKLLLVILLGIISLSVLAQRRVPRATQDVSPALLKTLQVEQHTFEGSLPYCQNKPQVPVEALVVLLHGRSGSGTDNLAQLANPAVKPLLTYVGQTGKRVLVLMPQAAQRGGWSAVEDKVARLVSFKIREYHLPADKVYISGVSMGGGGVYSLMATRPGLFSKAVLVSAGGRADMAPKMKGQFLLIHGEQDRVIPFTRAEQMAQALAQNKAVQVDLWPLAGRGHIDGAQAAYSAKTWDWLFGEQTK